MSRPVLRAAASTRGFGIAQGGIPLAGRTVEIERLVGAMRGMPAILETSRGLRVELVFAVTTRGTGSAIAFTAREDSLVTDFDAGTISFISNGKRLAFKANMTRGKDGRLYATFPSSIDQS